MTRSKVCRVVLAIAVATALTGAAACTASYGPDPEDTAAAHRTRALAALRSAERSTQRARSVRVRSTTALGSLMSTRAEGPSAGRTASPAPSPSPTPAAAPPI